MGLKRLAISNPSADTDTTLFTADNQYLMSVIATNKSASSADLSVWVEPAGTASASQYAYIVYELPIDGLNSYETFRFAVNTNDTVKVRTTSASVSCQGYGIIQYDVTFGYIANAYSTTAPVGPVQGQIWVDSDGTVSGSSAKPTYIWNGTSWIELAGGVLNTDGNYTWSGNNTFTGTVVLPNGISNYEKSIPLQASEPSSPSTSDLWVDSTSMQLKVYNGTTWVALGAAVDDSQLIIAQRMFS